MDGTALEKLLRRDRLILLASLGLITVLAWAAVLGLGAAMHDGMDGHSAMGGESALAPALAPWTPGQALIVALMWVAMMIGMMTPSAAAMILLYARVGRQARAGGSAFAPTGGFASGYLLAWAAAALLATLLQWALEQALLLTPDMAAATPRLGGALLVAAGLYQWTPLKQACLAKCRTPFQFIQRHGGFRADRGGALALGLRHGAYCIGCCWALMLLLFVGGVMNLLWIAGLAALVLAEKIGPWGRHLSRAAGLALAGAGIALLAGLV